MLFNGDVVIDDSGNLYLGNTSGSQVILDNTGISGGNKTIIFPNASDTLVGKATTDTLTNKTINAANNTISGITLAMLGANVVNTNMAVLGIVKNLNASGVAVDKTGGKVGLPSTAHGFSSGDSVTIASSVAYNATYTLDATTSLNELVVTATFAEETFSGSETATKDLGDSTVSSSKSTKAYVDSKIGGAGSNTFTDSYIEIDSDSSVGKFRLSVNSSGTNNIVTLKAPITSQNVTLTLPDVASDTLVSLTAQQTLTNKTLTAPKINAIVDASTNEILKFASVSTAVNEVTISNSATTGTPSISSTGDDTNINLNLVPKGTGKVQINGSAISLANSFTTSGNYTVTLTATNTTAVTLPTTGTLATLAGEETFTNKTLTSPVISSITNGAATISVPSTTGTLALTSDLHTQGTDTGTTSSTFTLDSDSSVGKFILSVGTAGTDHSVTLKAPVTTQAVVLTLPDIAADTLVGLAAQQTLTNKTLTAPKVDKLNDSNGNEVIILGSTADAINEVTISNNSAGQAVQIAATGGDTNISINLTPKGTGVVNLSDKVMTRVTLKDYAEYINAIGNVTGATAVDFENGNVQSFVMTGNITLSFTNPPASGSSGTLTIYATQDASGLHTISFPESVTWPAGTPPTMVTTANRTDILTFNTKDGGTTWLGFLATSSDKDTNKFEDMLDVALADKADANVAIYQSATSKWVNKAVSGDAVISNAGAVTVSKIGGKTISLANSFTTSGNYTVTLTATNTTAITLPTTGTLATLAGLETFTNKTLTSPKFNEDVALTSTSTELNLLDGFTAISTDGTFATPVDTKLATQLAISTYVGAKVAASTGTTSSTFLIDSDGSTAGVTLKANAGVLEILNSSGNDFADIHARNAHFDGTITYIDSVHTHLAESMILVDSGVTDNSANANGGLEVKRLDDETQSNRAIQSLTVSTNTIVLTSGHGVLATDYIQISGATNPLNNGYYKVASVTATDVVIDPAFVALTANQAGAAGNVAVATNAQIEWNEGNKYWQAGTIQAKKKVALFYKHDQSSSSATWTITHGLGQQFIMVQVFNASNAQVQPNSVTHTSATQTTVTFSTAMTGYAVCIG